MNFNLPQKSVPSAFLIPVGVLLTCLGLIGFAPSGSERVLRSLGQLLLAGGVLLLVKPKLPGLWLWPLTVVLAGLFFFLPIPQTVSVSSIQPPSPIAPAASTPPTEPLVPPSLSLPESTLTQTAVCDMFPGLVGYWSGEDDTQDRIGENHGTLHGVTFALGKVGQAFSFDGMDDFVDIPDNPDHSLDLATNFTLIAWIFNRGPGNNQADRYKDYRIILEKRHLQVNSWSYGLVLLPSDILQGIVAAETGKGVSIDSPTAVPRNTWSHIAMTYDGSQLQLYLNGNLVTKKATTLVPSINDESIRFGNWNHLELGDIQHFNGLIDEVEIYNRALSATEIQSIFTMGNTGKCEPASGLNSAESATPIIRFSESFKETSLDPTSWTILKKVGMMVLDESILSLSGGEHKRLNTLQTFSATPGGVSAKARIRLSGDYQKFGLGINPTDYYPGSATGFYFDTCSRSDESNGHENAVRLLGIDLPAGQKTPTFLLSQETPVTWNEFHDFEIVWTSSTVSFYIDGEQKASVPYTFTGNLPVGIWNDRHQLMQVDWVEVSASE